MHESGRRPDVLSRIPTDPTAPVLRHFLNHQASCLRPPTRMEKDAPNRLDRRRRVLLNLDEFITRARIFDE